MSKEPKITQEQLKKQLENGKSYKQIAHEKGYGYPSRRLSDKVRDLGYKKNQSLSIRKGSGNDYCGGSNFYVAPSVLQDSLEKKGLEESDNLFFKSWTNEKGNIEIEPTKEMWRKEE